MPVYMNYISGYIWTQLAWIPRFLLTLFRILFWDRFKSLNIVLYRSSRLSREHAKSQNASVVTTNAAAFIDAIPVGNNTTPLSAETQLTNLSDRKKSSKDFHQVFVKNVNIIFQYTIQDIEKIWKVWHEKLSHHFIKHCAVWPRICSPKFANMRAKTGL